MSIFSKISQSFAENESDEKKDAPDHTTTEKLLSRAANLFLKGYQRTINSLLEKYKHELPLDHILEKKEVQAALNTPLDLSKLSHYEIISIASNRYDTLDKAIELHSAFRKKVSDKYAELQQSLKDKPDDGSKKKDLIEVRKQLDEIDGTGTNWNLLLSGLKKARDGNRSEADADLTQLTRNHPDLNHPLLALFMVEKFTNAGGDEIKKWVDRALYFFPLDRDLLKKSIKLNPHTELQKQLARIA